MNTKLLRKEWGCVLRINPFATEDDIEDIIEIDEWDLLIIFKDGRRIVYDKFTNYHRTDRPYTGELTDEQEKNEFKHNLLSIMSRKHVTQEELSELVGTSQTMISHYVSGRYMPSALMLRKMAKALKCSMDDFFYQSH